MLLPLLLGEDRVGALVAAHTCAHPDGFPRVARRVGEAVAQHAALALVNARMFLGARTDLDQLEELDERKADYVAGLSHDLRSPLAGLMGSVATLRRLEGIASDEERREYLEIMERQVSRLTGMVDDMLLGARLDAGGLQPDHPRLIDLDALVRDICSLLAPAHRNRVVVQGVAAEPVTVSGDRRHLERVVQNLLDNALTHTPASARVTLGAERDGDQAVLTVHDDGPGIPSDVLGGIFDRYGSGERRRGDSTGLGLYTTRGIVGKHGGTIEVHSDPTSGTTFSVRLPAAEPRG
jgi:two-component system OmpR family sensor kinase